MSIRHQVRAFVVRETVAVQPVRYPRDDGGSIETWIETGQARLPHGVPLFESVTHPFRIGC